MRIGYEALLLGSENTGVEIAQRELLAALVAAAPEDEFIVYTHPDAVEQLPSAPNVTARPIASTRFGRFSRIFWQQTGAPRAARADSLDLYHGAGYVVSPRIAVPTIVSVYDTIALDTPKLCTRANAAHYRLAVPQAIAAANRVLVPSQYVRQHVLDQGTVSPNLVTVIPLGVSSFFRNISANEEALLDRHRKTLKNNPYALAVGTLEKKKNYSTLLKSWALAKRRRSSNLKLVLVGKDGNDASRLRRMTRRYGLEEDVLFLGYVSTESLLALYNAADLLLYPSLTEGFGFPPLEAMACGTPVIAANSTALPEILGQAAHLADPESPSAWRTAVEEVSSNKKLQQSLIRAGAKQVKKYTWTQCAHQVLDVYRETVNGRVPLAIPQGNHVSQRTA